MLITRHGRKQYHNFKNEKNYSELPPLDPDLTSDGFVESYETYLYYCRQLQIPPLRIVSSPFKRNISSAIQAKAAIKDYFNVDVDIFIDTNIGEYFSTKYLPLKKRYFYNSTWELMGKTSYSRSSKIELDFSICSFLSYCKENVWYISHGYFLKSLAYYLGIDIDEFGYNDGIYFDSNEEIKKIFIS